jgi:two-component system, OmpR family, sensor histidine kinase TctE
LSNLKPAKLSIRKKLLLWLLIPLICLCTVSSLVAYRLAEKFANESYDKLLMRSAEAIAARLSRNESGVVVADLPMSAQAILRHKVKNEFYYQIADSYGHRLTGDSVLPLPRDTSDKEPKFRYADVGGQTIRIYRIAVRVHPSPDEIWVQVAEPLESRQQFLEQIFLSILAPQLVLILLASLSVWIGIRHGLDPLVRLGRLLQARDKLDLSPVDIGTVPAELAPVTESLNQLLLNANNHIQLQHQFIGNAAHQLRTPVTALKTYVDYAQRISEDDNSALAGVLMQMSEAAGRVAHMINRLLTLARTEEKGPKAVESVDLIAVVNNAATQVVHEALNRGVQMEFNLPDNFVTVIADPGALSEMLTNLFDNAIKYTSSAGSVWVTVKDSKPVTLTVEDNGPGISDSEKYKIFERFYRVPGTAGSGCGLGLSIVSEIAAANNIKIEVLDRDGGGTSFRAVFPD